ncbi:MAG: oligosaccharide repeat unit polymerase [Bacteroidales bacterium]|nr:oligosaccharide repeat unit polymerase [Bacteroidales bacterium]
MNIQLKIKRVALIIFLVLLIFQILLFFRYQFLGVKKNLIAFEVILFAGALLVLFSFQKWQRIINPISIYYIFIFGFGYSLLELSEYSRTFKPISIVILILTIVSFSTGALLNIKIRSPFTKLRFTNRSNLIIYYILLAISLCSFAFEMRNIGYLPLLNVFSFDVYNDANERLVSFIHYFAMLFAIFPAWTYILYKRDLLTKRWLRGILLLSIFVILNYLSRQTIILFLVTYLLTYVFYNKINYRKIAFYSFGIILVFFIIGQIRVSQIEIVKSDKNYSSTQFLRNFAGINYKTNLVETTFTLYSSIRYSKLDELVEKSKREEYLGMGKYMLRPLISLTFMDRVGIIEYEEKYNVVSILATYAIDAYLDFGILGVIIIGIFYGLISSHFYRNFVLADERYIISWAIIIFCIIMASFMNYFSSFFVFLIWMTNKLIV